MTDAPSDFVACSDAATFAQTIPDGSINLLAIDPPFFGVVADEWDNRWDSVAEFAEWFVGVLQAKRCLDFCTRAT